MINQIINFFSVKRDFLEGIDYCVNSIDTSGNFLKNSFIIKSALIFDGDYNNAVIFLIMSDWAFCSKIWSIEVKKIFRAGLKGFSYLETRVKLGERTTGTSRN